MNDPKEELSEEEIFLQISPVERIVRAAEAEEEMFGCVDKDTCWEGIETIRQESINDQIDDSLSSEVLEDLLKNPNGW